MNKLIYLFLLTNIITTLGYTNDGQDENHIELNPNHLENKLISEQATSVSGICVQKCLQWSECSATCGDGMITCIKPGRQSFPPMSGCTTIWPEPDYVCSKKICESSQSLKCDQAPLMTEITLSYNKFSSFVVFFQGVSLDKGRYAGVTNQTPSPQSSWFFIDTFPIKSKGIELQAIRFKLSPTDYVCLRDTNGQLTTGECDLNSRFLLSCSSCMIPYKKQCSDKGCVIYDGISGRDFPDRGKGSTSCQMISITTKKCWSHINGYIRTDATCDTNPTANDNQLWSILQANNGMLKEAKNSPEYKWTTIITESLMKLVSFGFDNFAPD